MCAEIFLLHLLTFINIKSTNIYRFIQVHILTRGYNDKSHGFGFRPKAGGLFQCTFGFRPKVVSRFRHDFRFQPKLKFPLSDGLYKSIYRINQYTW